MLWTTGLRFLNNKNCHSSSFTYMWSFQRPDSSTAPPVFVQVDLRMTWSEFCSDKSYFIADLREIIHTEKQVLVEEERFIINFPSEVIYSSVSLLLTFFRPDTPFGVKKGILCKLNRSGSTLFVYRNCNGKCIKNFNSHQKSLKLGMDSYLSFHCLQPSLRWW